MTDIMCHKWFAKFCAGDFSLDDAPQLGRQVEVDNNRIEKLRKSTLFHGGSIRHIQNIHVNKVISEN